MTLFRHGRFILASGRRTEFKIDCDALDLSDFDALAWLIASNWSSFSEVEGVPSGGERLAQALVPYREDGHGLLIVDDVLTTGESMERQRADRRARGFVIFDRSHGLRPTWVDCLFELPERGVVY